MEKSWIISISVGTLTYLNTLLAEHMPIQTCYILLLVLTVPMYVMLSEISEHNILCCYCSLHPY